MIEDELWLVLGIIMVIFVGIFIYLLFTDPNFQNILRSLVLKLKIPAPWKR